MQPNDSRKAHICDFPSLAAVACAFLLAPLHSVASPHPARNRNFTKNDQLFHGIRASPEVGDAVFHNSWLGFSVLSERYFLLVLPIGFD